jgi:hypothetical protein
MPQQQLAPQLPGGTATGPGINAGGSVPNATMTMFTNGRIFLAAFTLAFASAAKDPFKGHGPGAGDWVIATFTDPVTHMYLLGAGGTTDTIY